MTREQAEERFSRWRELSEPEQADLWRYLLLYGLPSSWSLMRAVRAYGIRRLRERMNGQ